MKYIPLSSYRTIKLAVLAISDLLYFIRGEYHGGRSKVHAGWGVVGIHNREAFSAYREIFEKEKHVATIGLYFTVTGPNEITVYRAVQKGMILAPEGQISKAETRRRELILNPIMEMLNGSILVEEVALRESVGV